MAVQVRFQRKGSTHRPFYHLVATDGRNPRDGRFIEKLGYYDPKDEPSTFVFKEDRVKHWFDRGATLSNTAEKLLRKHKFNLKREKPEA